MVDETASGHDPRTMATNGSSFTRSQAPAWERKSSKLRFANHQRPTTCVNQTINPQLVSVDEAASGRDPPTMATDGLSLIFDSGSVCSPIENRGFVDGLKNRLSSCQPVKRSLAEVRSKAGNWERVKTEMRAARRVDNLANQSPNPYFAGISIGWPGCRS